MDNERIIDKIEFSRQSVTYEPHFHNAYEMIYILKGRIRMVFNNRVLTAGPDSLTFISNLEEHSIALIEEPYERYYVIIPSGPADRMVGDSKLLSLFKNRPLSFKNVFDVSAIKSEVSGLFAALLEDSRRPDEYAEAGIGCLLKRLLICVYRNNRDQFPLLRENVRAQVYDVQKYFDRHFREHISVEEVAGSFYISACYLSHCFKELTGFSPKRYIMLNRLAYAKNLLANTEMPVSEIAFRSGFNDTNNFIRHFKEHHNITPNGLRKTIRT